jgi:Base plate wedge protein 53
MQYFSVFPTIPYSFDPANGSFQIVTNIFARVKFLDSVLANTLIYYPYSVQDGDTPWSIADKYYDDPQRHWVVLFTNQILNPYFDWPLTQTNLQAQIVEKYGSLANAESTLDHVEQQTQYTSLALNGLSTTWWANVTLNASFTYDFTNGQLQTLTLPSVGHTLPGPEGSYTAPDGSIVSYTSDYVGIDAYTVAIENNEANRIIQILDKQYVGAVESQLQQLLAQ